jgi:hypothetical protein
VKRAVVVPVDGPIRFVEWERDGQLLPLLHREIGTVEGDTLGLNDELVAWFEAAAATRTGAGA